MLAESPLEDDSHHSEEAGSPLLHGRRARLSGLVDGQKRSRSGPGTPAREPLPVFHSISVLLVRHPHEQSDDASGLGICDLPGSAVDCDECSPRGTLDTCQALSAHVSALPEACRAWCGRTDLSHSDVWSIRGRYLPMAVLLKPFFI